MLICIDRVLIVTLMNQCVWIKNVFHHRLNIFVQQKIVPHCRTNIFSRTADCIDPSINRNQLRIAFRRRVHLVCHLVSFLFLTFVIIPSSRSVMATVDKLNNNGSTTISKYISCFAVSFVIVDRNLPIII